MESQENDSLAKNSARSGLVASLVCAVSSALFVAFGLAYKRRKNLRKGEGGRGAGGVFQENEDFPENHRQTAALVSVPGLTCSQGFDSEMIYPSECHQADESQSMTSCDPLLLCADSLQSGQDSPDKTLFSQPLFAQQRRRNMPKCIDATLEQAPTDPVGRRRKHSSDDDQAVMAQAVIIGEVNRAPSRCHSAEEDGDAPLIAQTESEDEDVPMRVVDLIRFFTPQRPLEPPGNLRRR
jgi:hypothetical protein